MILMKKVEKKSEITEISLINKFLILCLLFFLITFCSTFALRFDMGIGAEKIVNTVPFLHLNLNTNYLIFENDFTYLQEFGMIDTLGIFFKLDSKLTPKFGISTCWGYNQLKGFFFEKNGIILTAGISYFLERYSVAFSVGEYIAFDGRISERPIIKFSCSIKIGEW